ncbi:DedA family protein [Puniceibacterium sediminis]|uniref:Membrane protein DedA, SNARE-associated domain n=1 Tax=Puniceibacterium sediminis TaxID=1608407 RepID=A0A238V0I9_9RHOB|nr:VTT domain-containing protein [Puniceibacterium sediminis]SNR28062.1 membrane protein DedA, SNARE-associated domain [Puniceibacterium sediminis]
MIENLIHEYGVIAIYIGCVFEGDTVAITGGVLAHRGLIPFWPVVFAAIAGGLTTDTITFWLGRRFRDHPRVLRAVSHPLSQRLTATFLSRPLLLACLFRFIPGARTLAPVMLATATRIRGLPYTVATAVSACIWGVVMVSVGRQIGELLTRILGHFTRTEIVLLVALMVLALFLLRTVWRYFRTDPPET